MSWKQELRGMSWKQWVEGFTEPIQKHQPQSPNPHTHHVSMGSIGTNPFLKVAMSRNINVCITGWSIIENYLRNVFSFLYEYPAQWMGGSLRVQWSAAPKPSCVGGQCWSGLSSPVTLSLKGCEHVERKATLGLGTDLGEHHQGERTRRSGIGSVRAPASNWWSWIRIRIRIRI